MNNRYKLALTLTIIGNICSTVFLESGQGTCLEGAKCVPFERSDATEHFADYSFFPTTICLGHDDEFEYDVDGGADCFVTAGPAGIIIDGPNDSSMADPFGLMASISFDDESGLQGEPKELVAERHTIKGCRGRALH